MSSINVEINKTKLKKIKIMSMQIKQFDSGYVPPIVSCAN